MRLLSLQYNVIALDGTDCSRHGPATLTLLSPRLLGVNTERADRPAKTYKTSLKAYKLLCCYSIRCLAGTMPDASDGQARELRQHGRTSTRSFSVAAPMLWNSFPDSLRHPTLSIDNFISALKTHLFVARCVNRSTNLLLLLLLLHVVLVYREDGRRSPVSGRRDT